MNSSSQWYRFGTTCLLVGALSACGGDDGIVGTGISPADTIGNIEVVGSAEKGPYVKGSEVFVSALAADGTPSANTTLSEITDDLGSFAFRVQSPGPVLIAADGYHFNELTGRLSEGRLLLRAVYNASAASEQRAHVNVLTHLAYKRILALLAQGMNIDEALRQAESEVVEALRPVLPVSELTDFTQFSVYDIDANQAAGNGYILALSSTVYQVAMQRHEQQDSSMDAELTALLNRLADDLGDDGQVSDTATIAELTAATRVLRPDEIRANLTAYSVDIRQEELPVANMDLYLDTDGDGAVNAEDEDSDNDGITDDEDSSPYVYSEPPLLLTTSVAADLHSQTPFTLTWQTSEYAQQIEVQVARDTSFADLVVSEFVADSSLDLSLDAGVYYLRTRAQSATGGWGPWSVITELPVDAFAHAYDFTFAGGEQAYFPLDPVMTATADGGLALFLESSQGATLIKLDADGRIAWQQPAGAMIGHGLTELSDGRLAYVTRSAFNCSPWCQEQVVTISQDGQTMTFSEPLPEAGAIRAGDTEAYMDAVGIIETTDGLAVGVSIKHRTSSWDARLQSSRVVKLDAAGNVVLIYDLDFATYGSLHGFWKTNAGNLGLASRSKASADIIFSGHAITELSQDGTQFTPITVASGKGDPAAQVVPTSNEGYAVLIDDGLMPRLTAFSAAGSLLHSKSLSPWCSCRFVISKLATTTDRLIFGGKIDSYINGGSSGSHVPLVMGSLSLSGGALSVPRYYSLDPESPLIKANAGATSQLRHFRQRGDGSYWLLGTLADANNSQEALVVIKTDPAGNAPAVLSTSIDVSL